MLFTYRAEWIGTDGNTYTTTVSDAVHAGALASVLAYVSHYEIPCDLDTLTITREGVTE